MLAGTDREWLRRKTDGPWNNPMLAVACKEHGWHTTASELILTMRFLMAVCCVIFGPWNLKRVAGSCGKEHRFGNQNHGSPSIYMMLL